MFPNSKGSVITIAVGIIHIDKIRSIKVSSDIGIIHC